MRNYIKIYFLFLTIIELIILLSPSFVSAQFDRDSLILRYVSGGYNSELIPGETKSFFMEVANNSYSPTTNIHFTSDAPKGWAVEFIPESIDFISARSFQTVEIRITALDTAVDGDYSVAVIADSDVGRRVMNIYVRLKEHTNLWILVGGILGAVVIITFVFIYRHFGKD